MPRFRAPETIPYAVLFHSPTRTPAATRTKPPLAERKRVRQAGTGTYRTRSGTGVVSPSFSRTRPASNAPRPRQGRAAAAFFDAAGSVRFHASSFSLRRATTSGCCAATSFVSPRSAAQLYDLAADRGETKDVAAQHPDVVARLKEKLLAWNRTLPAASKKAAAARP